MTGDHMLRVRLADAVRLADILESVTQDLAQAAGPEPIPPRVAFDVYARTLRELRAVVIEARERVDRATTLVAEASLFARRRRRRARKIAALRQRADRRGGAR